MTKNRFWKWPAALVLGAALMWNVPARADDDDVERSIPVADQKLWDKLDWNPDDFLDGKELEGGWIRFDENRDGMTSRDEFFRGLARERASRKPAPQKPALTKPALAKPAPQKVAPRKSVAKTRVRQNAVPQARVPQSQARVTPPTVKRRAGFIVGRAIFPNGAPVPAFRIEVSGFEDGKPINYFMNGGAAENAGGMAQGKGGRYALKVPQGAYRARGYVTYNYRGRVYNFELEPSGPPSKLDFPSSGLEKLRGGLIRNFVLKMTGKRPGASEATETVYRYAYYGGTVNLDARGYEGPFNALSTPLRNAYPPESRILLTLTPQGPLVDGSKGTPINANFPLGDDGKWTFMVRGIFPGLYRASARLQLPDGQIKPLRLGTEGYGSQGNRVVFNRFPSVMVDFKPSSIGPAPRMGVDAVTLYLGE